VSQQIVVTRLHGYDQLSGKSIQPDVVKEQFSRGAGALNTDGQAGDIVQVRVDRRQVDVPCLPSCQRQVAGVAAVIDLDAVDLSWPGTLAPSPANHRDSVRIPWAVQF